MPFYDPKKMKKKPAGPKYSKTTGAWITGERMLFGEMVSPAGTGSLLHSHPNEQFIFVKQGTLKGNIEGKKKTVPAGDIVHIPANAVHSMVATEEEDVVFIVAKDVSWGIDGIRVDDAPAQKGGRKKAAGRRKTPEKAIKAKKPGR